jgi:hypothetical protein
MTSHHRNLSEPTEDSPISREELNGFTKLLEQFSAQSSPNIQGALQPTVIVLEKLVRSHQSLQKEIAQQQEIIKDQGTEIKKLKNQSEQHGVWLLKYINYKTIGVFSLVSAIVFATLLTGFQTLLPVKIDGEAIDKLNFLYFQELERYKKAKTGRKK